MTTRPATPRVLRHVLQPMIAGAVLAAARPHLTANSIEIDHIDPGHGGEEAGLRVFLYQPEPGLFEQWADAIGATHSPAPQPTSRPGEFRRTVTGRVGHTLVEVTCVAAAGQWTWRTNAGRSVHKRDHNNPAVAACGRLIVGVADPAHWHLPGYRCAECAHGDIPAGAVR